MEIRLLGAQDIHAWKQFRLEALQDAPESFGSSYEEEVTYTEHDWAQGLDRSSIFGAFVDGVLVGAAGFYTLNLLKTKHRGVLFGMHTTPKYRGRGIANALIKAVIMQAKSRVSQINLTCVTSNLRALKLYQKHGFKIYGTEPYALKIGDKFFDEHLMILDLRSESFVSS